LLRVMMLLLMLLLILKLLLLPMHCATLSLQSLTQPCLPCARLFFAGTMRCCS
jgi:hypothetical protein